MPRITDKPVESFLEERCPCGEKVFERWYGPNASKFSCLKCGREFDLYDTFRLPLLVDGKLKHKNIMNWETGNWCGYIEDEPTLDRLEKHVGLIAAGLAAVLIIAGIYVSIG